LHCARSAQLTNSCSYAPSRQDSHSASRLLNTVMLFGTVIVPLFKVTNNGEKTAGAQQTATGMMRTPLLCRMASLASLLPTQSLCNVCMQAACCCKGVQGRLGWTAGLLGPQDGPSLERWGQWTARHSGGGRFQSQRRLSCQPVKHSCSAHH
jgi:hypothetical protein